MTIDEAIREWKNKKRKMGCVSATKWFCDRVDGFWPVEITRYNREGESFGHTVATDGIIAIDISPYNDRPNHKAKSQTGCWPL